MRYRSIICCVCCLISSGMAGCRGRDGSFFTAKPELFQSEDPDWVFEAPGTVSRDGESVIQAVGVGMHAPAHSERFREALDHASMRLEKEIYSVAVRMGVELVKDAVPPSALKERFVALLDDAAATTAAKLAGEAEHLLTYESLLRREVFVQRAVPVGNVQDLFHAIASAKLRSFLKEEVELDGDEPFRSRLEALLGAI